MEDEVPDFADVIRIGLTWVFEGDSPLDDDNNQVDLTGASVYCQVRNEAGGKLLLECTGEVPTSTTWRVTGDRDDTALLKPGTAVADVLYVLPDGSADILCRVKLRIVRTVTELPAP